MSNTSSYPNSHQWMSKPPGSTSMAVGKHPYAIADCFLQTRAIPAAVNATRGYAADAKATPTEVSSILEQRIRGVQEEASLAETGRVLSVG